MKGSAPDAARATLLTGGLRLHARAWPASASSAPAVLLLHATSFCGNVWGPLWRAAGVGGAWSAVAPDARGHGASDAPGERDAYAWTRLVDDVVAWIDWLSPSRPGCAHGDGVVLVGHSCGATTALAAAADRPGSVRGVLAIEPVLFDAPPPGADADSYPGSRVMAAQALRRRTWFESLDEARARLASRPPYAGFAPEVLDAFLAGGLAREADGSVTLRCAPATESACYHGAGALDLWPALGRIVCPVRIVAGEKSFLARPLVRRIEERIPGTRIEEIAGGTHFMALEQPDVLGGVVARFLRQVTPTRVA